MEPRSSQDRTSSHRPTAQSPPLAQTHRAAAPARSRSKGLSRSAPSPGLGGVPRQAPLAIRRLALPRGSGAPRPRPARARGRGGRRGIYLEAIEAELEDLPTADRRPLRDSVVPGERVGLQIEGRIPRRGRLLIGVRRGRCSVCSCESVGPIGNAPSCHPIVCKIVRLRLPGRRRDWRREADNRGH